jgi:hypothetical protein
MLTVAEDSSPKLAFPNFADAPRISSSKAKGMR